MKTLRLSAALAALILAAPTAWAGVMDFGNALGSSGGYTSQAYYQAMLAGQPMTASEQAYADQEDELRQMGFQAELGGDFAVGQMFYQIAYGLTPGSPSAGLGWLGAFGERFLGPGAGGVWNWSGGGSSDGSGSSSDSLSSGGSVFTTTIAPIPGGFLAFSVPEPSTWAMMLLGFGGLAYAGWRRSRKPALPSA